MAESQYTIRPFQGSDESAILALNLEFESRLSPMDHERFLLLQQQASYLQVAENSKQISGFLMAFAEGSKYDSTNYQWFAKRYSSFIYVDRIVIATTAQRQGLGKQFYQNLQQWAKNHGKRSVTAEVDLLPPNPVSMQFHLQYAALGLYCTVACYVYCISWQRQKYSTVLLVACNVVDTIVQ